MIDALRRLEPEMTSWRRDFHRHPELAFEEHRTSQKVAELLSSFGIEVHRGLAGTGVVGTLRSGSSERRIALRADMDALPIQEENTFEHRSQVAGKMHACGHDGHTSMLLGAARHLAEHRDFDGTVYFVFQPAEEAGGGAKVMIDDGLFERFPAEKVFGMHNFPGVEVGEFGLCSGPMLAAVDVVHYAVTSPGGHAAIPHATVDTVVVSAEILMALQTIVSRNVDPLHNTVVSITQVHGGHADNIIPSRVEHGGCVRTFLPEVQALVEKRIDALIDGVTRAHGASYELDYEYGYPATVNSEAEVQEAADAAGKIGKVDRATTPIMGSEDFSFMLQARPGAFIFTGNGASDGLHTPLYDFDDDVLPIGAAYWVALVRDQLSR